MTKKSPRAGPSTVKIGTMLYKVAMPSAFTIARYKVTAIRPYNTSKDPGSWHESCKDGKDVIVEFDKCGPQWTQFTCPLKQLHRRDLSLTPEDAKVCYAYWCERQVIRSHEVSKKQSRKHDYLLKALQAARSLKV